jgi:hypothetical protein
MPVRLTAHGEDELSSSGLKLSGQLLSAGGGEGDEGPLTEGRAPGNGRVFAALLLSRRPRSRRPLKRWSIDRLLRRRSSLFRLSLLVSEDDRAAGAASNEGAHLSEVHRGGLGLLDGVSPLLFDALVGRLEALVGRPAVLDALVGRLSLLPLLS